MGMQTVENYRELKQEVKKCDCINQLFGNHFLVHLYIVRSIPKRARKSIKHEETELPRICRLCSEWSGFFSDCRSTALQSKSQIKSCSYSYRSTFCQMSPTLTPAMLSFIQVSCVGFVAPKLINWGRGSRHQRPASLPQSSQSLKGYQDIRGFPKLGVYLTIFDLCFWQQTFFPTPNAFKKSHVEGPLPPAHAGWAQLTLAP